MEQPEEDLKNEINEIKNYINSENQKLDEIFQTQKERVTSKLNDFNLEGDKTREELTTMRDEISTFKTNFVEFIKKTTSIKEIIASSDEYQTLSLDELSNKFKDESSAITIKIDELDKKTDYINDKKDTFFNWELNEGTYSKNSNKERYTNNPEIQEKLNETTGLKNMFAALLGYDGNYSDLYNKDGWIIKKENLSSAYDNWDWKYKDGYEFNEGLHPRLLENWLIFNWDFNDRNPKFGDDNNQINIKINELYNELVNTNDLEKFKKAQFDGLASRVSHFNKLIKNPEQMTEEKTKMAKEYSEAYLSSYLNLAIEKYESKKILTEKLEKLTTNIETLKQVNDFLNETSVKDQATETQQ
ncbi:hypothetical protein JXZ92_00280 [Mycoplasma sp. CSL10137]|uniref:hypothetical protein n=1 Tax=Mycoplasma sp. CSL10137 TaxID=2813824 RepID=UPI00197C6627|nr:hypothetical protein [Mycoplasma sp. CSL10137]MBN4083259.1 hypothetical protein [Mycoplasma sp. CSL10137]